MRGRERVSNFHDSKLVKTRKKHSCFICQRKFPKGSELIRCNGVYDGDWYSYYLCQFCDRLLSDEEYQDVWDDTLNEEAFDIYIQNNFECPDCKERPFEREWIDLTHLEIEFDCDCSKQVFEILTK